MGTYNAELCTTERLLELWPQIRPIFERCCNEAAQGELDVDDIFNFAVTGRGFIFVERLDDVVTVALGIEFIPYPRMKVANVFALGGKQLLSAKTRYWKVVTEWLKANGCVAVEASVSEPMAKLLEKRFGFKQVYRQVRLPLGANDGTQSIP
jgi:hypothetical protein